VLNFPRRLFHIEVISKVKGTPKEAYVNLMDPGGYGSQISRQSAHYGGKVSPTHRPPLPPGISWYSFREAESSPGTWTCQMPRKKSPVTRSGIDPGTFRLVAQLLKHYVTPGPLHIEVLNESTQSRPYVKYPDLKCEMPYPEVFSTQFKKNLFYMVFPTHVIVYMYT
jgi:hypothetical protein